MGLYSSFIELLEPRTVMAVGSVIAFGTSGFLAIQAFMSTGYRWLFSVLSLSVCLAGASLCSNVVFFEDFTSNHTLFSLITGTCSYLLGMYSLILLYRPSMSKHLLQLAAVIAFSGFAIWTSNPGARNWTTIAQFVMIVSTLFVVAQARDDLAPHTRWLTLGLCVFGALGLIPRLMTMLDTGVDPGPGPFVLDSTSYRIRALVWTLSPVALYAVVTGVIHARIASKLKRALDLDVLTGAHSRRYLFEIGEQLLEQRTSEPAPSLNVLLIDVDHFKQVNDRWGHAVGDEVLKYIVRQIKDIVRVSDAVIARYGGEEFVVLVPTVNQEIANRLAERIRTHLKAHPFRSAELTLPITISIGVAANRGSAGLNTLISQADECLYRAKREGRDRVVYQDNLLLPV